MILSSMWHRRQTSTSSQICRSDVFGTASCTSQRTIVRFEPDVSAIEGVVRGLRCKKQPHISLQCPRGVARSQSSLGTRHETPLPPRPGPQDCHDRNLFVANLSANGGQLSSMTSAFVLRCLRRLRFKMLAPPWDCRDRMYMRRLRFKLAAL